MPELPEVETVRRALQRRAKGRRLATLEASPVGFNRTLPLDALRQAAGGRRLTKVGRRGKYLVLEFEGGRQVYVHLGMSGRLLFDRPAAHTRLRLVFGGAPGRDLEVFIDDPRRFGFAGLRLPPLGPEPLEAGFTPETFRRALRGRRAPIHAALLDQKGVAGGGNIYATEGPLAAAGIRPLRPAARLTADEVARLHRALREWLRRGIRKGGATLRDGRYVDPSGRAGRMQQFLCVYDRESCRRCGSRIRLAPRKLAGRTARYCPRCQK